MVRVEAKSPETPKPYKVFSFFKRERLVCGNFYTKTLIMKDDKVDCVYEN